MNIYDDNLRFLKGYSPELYQALRALPEKNYATIPSKSGPLTLTFHHNNEQYYIHSKYNPEREALKIVQNANLNADHIIVLGLGAGYHLEKIMKLKESYTRVLLVEPDGEIIKHSLKTLNWSNLFSRNDFFHVFGQDLNVLAETIHNFLDMVTFEKVEYIELASEVRFAPTFFSTARERIDNEIKTALYDFKTRLAEDSMVPKNILKNIAGILKTRPTKALENRFQGKPGFIVSAGPSLDKNILYLKKIRNRGVIICVDTALKPLLKKGIDPHFTVTADPSYKNYLHLLGTENKINYFLVSDTGISSQVYEDFHRHIFSLSLGKPIFKMIEQNIGEIGEVDAWGSVISVALNFAIYLGLEPIVFLGQDFAFTDMRNHCRGTTWEENWSEGTNDLATMQRKEKKSIAGVAKTIEPLDIHGDKTLTSDRLMLYKNYLAKTLTSIPGKQFINATDGGILTEIPQKSIHEVLSQYVFNREEIDFQELFDIPIIHSQQKKKQLITFLKAKAGFFKKYRKKMNEVLKKLEHANRIPFQSSIKVLEEAEKLKDHLYSNIQHGEIVEMWSQGPIYSFLKKSAKLKGDGVNEANLPEYVTLFQEYFNRLTPMVSNIIDTFDTGTQMLLKYDYNGHDNIQAQPQYQPHKQINKQIHTQKT